MRRAVELNVSFILISSLFHLIITEPTLENVTKNEEENSTFKSQIDLDDDHRAEQKLGKLSETNYNESDAYDKTTVSSWFQVNATGSDDNQTWPASYDDETELANYTKDYGDPKSGTTVRRRWDNTTERAQPKFSTTERNRWKEREFNVTGRNRWEETEFNSTDEAQPKFNTTARNLWEEREINTTGRNRWEETEFNSTDEVQPKFNTTERNRWEEREFNTTERNRWEETEFNATARNLWEEREFNTTERNRWEETEFNSTDEAQSKFNTTERNLWDEREFNTTGRNRWEETEFNSTDEAQPKFSTTERNRWEFSNHTESVTEELWTPSTESNRTSFEEEPTTPRPPLLYRNYGYVNDTKGGWLITLYDESDTPCLKMNLQIVINVYFARNDPRSSLKAASFIQTFPTSSDDLTVEGECNNDTSLVLISWETSNLTWHFDQGENGLWSLREVELSVTNPDWFVKYNFCGRPPFGDSPCHPFSLKSGNGSWYDSSTRCRQVNVPLTEEGTTPLKAVVFLMESFRVEPFARNGTDFETRIC